MKCKACETVLTGRQREFCSDKCRKRASRTGPGPEDGSGSTNADRVAVEPGQSERGQTSRTASGVEFKPECVTCDDLAPDEKSRACCVVDECPITQAMTDLDLQLKLKSYPGASWVNSPEHCEVLARRQAASPAPVHEPAGQGASQA